MGFKKNVGDRHNTPEQSKTIVQVNLDWTSMERWEMFAGCRTAKKKSSNLQHPHALATVLMHFTAWEQQHQLYITVLGPVKSKNNFMVVFCSLFWTKH